jgi:hypothetical protein
MMAACPFCSAPVDQDAADLSAAAFAKVNQACSDASYLKIMVGSALAFFLLKFSFFLTLLGVVGFRFLEVAVPVMVIRWFVKFGALRSDDPDFIRARSTAFDVGIGTAVFLALIASGVLNV